MLGLYNSKIPLPVARIESAMKHNKQRTDRQHTVARNYLSRFLMDGNKSLFVFDKPTKRIFPQSPSDASVENKFYDLPHAYAKEHLPGPDDDHQFVEHALAVVDGQFKLEVDRFLDEVPKKGITPEHRRMLAPHIIIQWMRGKELREALYQTKVRFSHAFAVETLKRKCPDVPIDVQIEYDKDSIDQTIELQNVVLIEELADILTKQIWMLGTNTTMQLLYTSDNPVVKKAHVFYEGKGLSGFKARGVEIAYPLTSKHCLLIFETGFHAKTFKRWENRTIPLVPPAVLQYNEMQVKGSYMHVYCGRKQFEQALGFCKRFPDVCDPN